MEWFLKASEYNHCLSIFHIGTMYSHGMGVEQDYKKAYEWLLKSANLRHADSTKELSVLEEENVFTFKYLFGSPC